MTRELLDFRRAYFSEEGLDILSLIFTEEPAEKGVLPDGMDLPDLLYDVNLLYDKEGELCGIDVLLPERLLKAGDSNLPKMDVKIEDRILPLTEAISYLCKQERSVRSGFWKGLLAWTMDGRLTENPFCPLVERKIDCCDCMENRSIIISSIPAEFKVKKNWERICENCRYASE